jgi:hypothetical protein
VVLGLLTTHDAPAKFRSDAAVGDGEMRASSRSEDGFPGPVAATALSAARRTAAATN